MAAPDSHSLKTVCYYCAATHLGGAEKSLLELLSSLRKDPGCGFTPWVLVPKAEGPLIDALSSLGIETVVLPMPRLLLGVSRSTPGLATLRILAGFPALIVYLARVVALLHRRRAELIHTNGLKCQVFSAIANFFLGRNLIFHLRDMRPKGILGALLTGAARASRATLIANSKATEKSWGMLSRSRVIYNGVDPVPKKTFRNLASEPESPYCLALVGALTPWKGQEIFVEMAGRLKAAGRRARYLIVGSSIYDTDSDLGYEERLRKLVIARGLASDLELRPFTRDLQALFHEIDFLVHASTRPEPFGRVIVEAMSAGITVVASAAGGVLEIVRDGENGLLYPPGDIESLVRRMEKLMDEPLLARRLAERGALHARAEFSPSAHFEQVTEVYRRLGRGALA